MSWTPPSLPAGHKVTGAELAQITAQIVALSVDWSDWVPTFTNFTQGNAGVSARYIQVGKKVTFNIKVTLGTTSTMGSLPRFSLPVTGASQYGAFTGLFGDCYLQDTGTQDFRGAARWQSTSALELVYYPSGGAAASVAATAPHVWASTDLFSVTGTYEAA
jgi:hypothetical protein